tara:strand:+ start:401 stop:1057 length:657 start_codon:yes stop_codon:yes gene_type:complete
MGDKLKPREKPHYVNNRDFSYAVVDYVASMNDAISKGEEAPVVTRYIAECFLKISNGLSHKPNFIRYTYKEEMVMDGVENCLKAIGNYNIEAATRTGKPNAFAYFTQICYFAFIRRITKEKKQSDLKWEYIDQVGIDKFIEYSEMGEDMDNDTQAYIDILKERISAIRANDTIIKDYADSKKGKPPAKKMRLEEFMSFDDFDDLDDLDESEDFGLKRD